MKKENKIVLPDGDELQDETLAIPTERTIEREHEETEYTPVIIKRWDEAVRHPDDTLEKAIEEGLEQLQRPALSLFLSSIAAGLIVGFSAMAVGVVTTVLAPFEQPLVTRIATAIVYPFGFVICVMSGAQLFTEHTATAVYPVLERREKLTRLFKLWDIIPVGGHAAGVGGLGSATPLARSIDDSIVLCWRSSRMAQAPSWKCPRYGQMNAFIPLAILRIVFND